jgi:hypothetical protein
MSVARSTLALLGTDESSGDTISNTSTDNGSEVDVLGADNAVGEIEIYLVYTSSQSTGSLDITINKRRATTQAYKKLAPDFSVTPNGAGTVTKIYLGRFSASRYMQVDVKNNGTGGNATNVAVLGELYKYT